MHPKSENGPCTLPPSSHYPGGAIARPGERQTDSLSLSLLPLLSLSLSYSASLVDSPRSSLYLVPTTPSSSPGRYTLARSTRVRTLSMTQDEDQDEDLGLTLA